MALTKINSSVIANNTIAVGNIADNSVDATKIASNSILTRHIDDNQIGIDQLNVSDGSNGQFLKTNGSGTLSFATVSTTTALDDIATGDAESTLATSTGSIILDSPADIILDADGGDINLKDGGTQFGNIGKGGGSDLIITASIADKDIFFTGTDGSSAITALTLDMSDAGTAIFNHDIVLGDDDVIKMGDTNEDFEIYHIGGSVNVIRGTNAMVLQSDDYISLGTHSGGELMLKATKNGSTDLYYDNAVTLETNTNGIKLKGGTTGGVEYLIFNNGGLTINYQSQYTLSGILNTGALIAIGQQRSNTGITYDHCLLFAETGTSLVTLADPSGRFAINSNNTSNKTNIYVNGGDVVIMNEVGVNQPYSIAVFVFQGN